MSFGNHLRLATLAFLGLALASCSGGGSDAPGLNSMTSAVQDLSSDPEGMTTVLTFLSSQGLAGASAGNFQASAGQQALTAVVSGSSVTVTWNARVTPSHTVLATGLSGVSTTFHGVSTSDSSAPTFAITSGTQNPGLGGDVIVVQFSGPHVVASEAGSLARWTLVENMQPLDLTGSSINFDASAQTATITLGTLANLHATYTVAASGVHSVADVAVSSTAVNGTATGDATAPVLVSADQNLSLDEYGRVIDFTFDKAMDPVFSVALAHYAVTLPDLATSVAQPSENVLRVTFNNPIVPGFDTVTLDGLTDLHGNAFPNGSQAISQPSPVANAYNGPVLGVTVPNAVNDYLQIVTTQAFDPDSAIDPTKWTLHVAGNLIDMTQQAFDYDLIAKTLTITLDFDMLNGNTFTLIGNGVIDVDGQAFNQGYFGSAAGDSLAPSVSAAAQNRAVDPSGKTLDVTLSEVADPVPAGNIANWSISGAQTLQTATLLAGGQVVRLVYDTLVLPGSVVLAVDHLKDLAGNAMAAPQVNIAITSTDTTPPSASSVVATAVEGADDDTFVVVFDDDMSQSEIETPANWHLESPVGTPITTVGTTVTYDAPTRTGTLVLANGVNLKRGDGFKASFTGMHDVAANAITSTPVTGLVQFESKLPLVNNIHRDGTQTDHVIVRFSEPCDLLTNLYDAFTNPTGTRYILRDNTGALRAFALSASVQDEGLGVDVGFGLAVDPTDTVDVLGATDLAGNPLFPALAVPTVAEDLGVPSLVIPSIAFTSVSGENNDVITVKFDRPMSPWKLLAPANYAANGSSTLDLSTGEYSFDGVDTVTIKLKSSATFDVLTGQTYNLGVNHVWSAQGTQRTTVDPAIGVIAGGDSTAPDVLIGNVRIDPSTADSLVVEFTEAMSATSAGTAGTYDYAGGNLATSTQLLGPRAVRTTFAVTPAVGQNLTLSVKDLAGNDTGSITRAVAAADAQPPSVASVSGTSVPGWGGDSVSIDFDEPVLPSVATQLSHYAIATGSTSLSLAGATAFYTSATNTITIRLPGGQELDATQPVSVTVSGIADVSGNVMSAPSLTNGAVGGDGAAPVFSGAFVNWLDDNTGRTIDVLFDEDVDQAFALVAGHWTCSGGQTVFVVTMMERNHFQLQISAALAASQTISINGIADLAHNAAGAISVDPVE